MVAHHTRAEVEAIAPTMEVGTSWEYDPMPVLRSLSIPPLWILAGDDSEAPPEETMRRLPALAGDGPTITTMVFLAPVQGLIELDNAAPTHTHATHHAQGHPRPLP